MALLLREADVRALLPMDQAVALVRQVLEDWERGQAVNQPRRRIKGEGCIFSSMSGASFRSHAIGLKAYASSRRGTTFLVALWDSERGELLALIEADWLGRIRTGAASGVATDALARKDASTVAIIGTGGQAQTQLEAVAAVRQLEKVYVFSRNSTRRAEFATDMEQRLAIEVVPTTTAEAAVSAAAIVTTITTSSKPTVEGAWLTPGTHVNAAGSNQPDRRELDSEVLARASTVAVDSIEQAKIEAGDLLIPSGDGQLSWDNVVQLGAVLTGDRAGRSTEKDITVFKSLGLAVEDVTTARFVYEQAVAQGYGEKSSFGDRP